MRSFTKKNITYGNELYYLIYHGKDEYGVDFDWSLMGTHPDPDADDVPENVLPQLTSMRTLDNTTITRMRRTQSLRKILNHPHFVSAHQQLLNLWVDKSLLSSGNTGLISDFKKLLGLEEDDISVRHFHRNVSAGLLPLLGLSTADPTGLNENNDGIFAQDGVMSKMLKDQDPNPVQIFKRLTEGEYNILEGDDRQTIKNISRLLVLKSAYKYAKIRSGYENLYGFEHAGIKYLNHYIYNSYSTTEITTNWVNNKKNFSPVRLTSSYDPDIAMLNVIAPGAIDPTGIQTFPNIHDHVLFDSGIWHKQHMTNTVDATNYLLLPTCLADQLVVGLINSEYMLPSADNPAEMVSVLLRGDKAPHPRILKWAWQKQANLDARIQVTNNLKFQSFLALRFIVDHFDKNAQNGYRKAKVSLIRSHGLYCAFCETPLNDGRNGDIEHKLPKSSFPTEALKWENFVHACKICNSDNKKEYIISQRLDDFISYNEVFYKNAANNYLSNNYRIPESNLNGAAFFTDHNRFLGCVEDFQNFNSKFKLREKILDSIVSLNANKASIDDFNDNHLDALRGNLANWVDYENVTEIIRQFKDVHSKAGEIEYSQVELNRKNLDQLKSIRKIVSETRKLINKLIVYWEDKLQTAGRKSYENYKAIAHNQVCWPDKNSTYESWKLKYLEPDGREADITLDDVDSHTEIKIELHDASKVYYVKVKEKKLLCILTSDSKINENIIDICGLSKLASTNEEEEAPDPDEDDVEMDDPEPPANPEDGQAAGAGQSSVQKIKSYWNDQRSVRRTKASVNAIKQLKVLSQHNLNIPKLITYYSQQLHPAHIKRETDADGNKTRIPFLREGNSDRPAVFSVVNKVLQISKTVFSTNIVDFSFKKDRKETLNLDEEDISDWGVHGFVEGTKFTGTVTYSTDAGKKTMSLWEVDIENKTNDLNELQITSPSVAYEGVSPSEFIEWEENRNQLIKALHLYKNLLNSYLWENILNLVKDGGFYTTWIKTFQKYCDPLDVTSRSPHGRDGLLKDRHDIDLVRRLEKEAQSNPEDPFQFHGTDAKVLLDHLKPTPVAPDAMAN